MLRSFQIDDPEPLSVMYITLVFLLAGLASIDPDCVAASSSDSLDSSSGTRLPGLGIPVREDCNRSLSPIVDLLRLCLGSSGLRYRSVLSL